MNIKISFLVILCVVCNEAMDGRLLPPAHAGIAPIVMRPPAAPYYWHTVVRPIPMRHLRSQFLHAATGLPTSLRSRMAINNPVQLTPGYSAFVRLTHSAPALSRAAARVVVPARSFSALPLPQESGVTFTNSSLELTRAELEALSGLAGMNKVRHGMKKVRASSLPKRAQILMSDSDCDEFCSPELVRHELPPLDEDNWSVTLVKRRLRYTCKFCDVVCMDLFHAECHASSNKHRKNFNLPLSAWNEKTYRCTPCRYGSIESQPMRQHLKTPEHKNAKRKAKKANENFVQN